MQSSGKPLPVSPGTAACTVLMSEPQTNHIFALNVFTLCMYYMYKVLAVEGVSDAASDDDDERDDAGRRRRASRNGQRRDFRKRKARRPPDVASSANMPKKEAWERATA